MYRHIVLFKFRDDIDSLNRDKAFLSFKEGIEALPAIIPTIKEIEVGENKTSRDSSKTKAFAGLTLLC